MHLELKIESNSPFWLIGISKGKTLAGSSTNIPCYFKSIKKQREVAHQIFKNDANVDEVYLLTGLQWDNMPSGAKEECGYIKTKGKLILSKDEITEGDYPKGVSRDPLPKKGVKTYTSVATTLEDKGDEKMKLELNDEKIIKEEVTSVDNISEDLQDRFFTTMSDGRPEMFKKFTKDELKLFADFVKQLPSNEITELERSMVLVAISLAHGDDLTVDSKNECDSKLKESQIMKEAVPVRAIICALMYTIDNWDTLKDIIETIKSTSNDIYEKSITIYEYLKGKNADVKEAAQEISKIITSDVLTESTIVTPVGNPQTAGSFVNIDVDLDHMEVSDFIVRLAQAIRSEQTSVLEYVALRSANGITNEERTNIDSIIEEEKNHMVAFTTMLYKQLLTNHKENIDKANNEFTLPTFGMEIFDNSNEGKLTESIATTIEKIVTKEGSRRMSDEYFIGNGSDGRMYHGLGVAMDVIKDMISTSGEQVVIQNVTINDSLNENKDIKTEDTFNSIDELINELKSDTNYDEIALHIHAYAKTNKARASELMDKLFELEKSKSPKDCVEELIKELESENEQYKTEDMKISLDGETMSQTQWDIIIDVDYDNDFHLQVLNNITNAIEELNKVTISEHYGIATDRYTLGGGKFNFVIITTNAFTGNVNEEFVSNLCDNLFNKASTYEYYIKRA